MTCCARISRPGLIPERMFLLPLADRGQPVCRVQGLDQRQHRLEHPLHVPDDRHIHPHVLADCRRVDVDMDDLRLRGESFHISGYTVVKPRADGNEHVAVMHGHVRIPCAVHAEHAHGERVVFRKGPECREVSS